MQTETIQTAGKEALIKEWGGVDKIDATVVEALLLDENDWCVVREKATNKTIAVFDIRSVPPKSPNFYKSMRLYFAPGFSLEIGADFDEMQSTILKTSQVLSTALARLLEVAEDSHKKKAKIFSTHPLITFLFREICQYLTENYPNRYTGGFYGNWIEIQTKEAENG